MSTSARALAAAVAAATITLVPALPASAQGVFVSPPPARAAAPLTGIRANVAQQLRFYGLGNVDVRRLTGSQVAQINTVLHSDRSEGDKRALIRSALSRPGRLQSVLSGSVGIGVSRRN